ncbi:MAG: hypothetical protein PSV13_13760 [Lacunisphaera sp.]|nr:hypothetical protein [Lacunisphaera sp.]
MKKYLPLTLCVLVLAGCNAGTMIRDQYDPKTGERNRTVYSMYYDDGNWIIPHHLGMSVVVDHEKTVIPVVRGIQTSMGALGPSDAYANGKVTVYIWNLDRDAHRVKIVRITSPGAVLEPKEKTFVGVEDERTGGEIGYIQISNYGTQIPLKVDYEINGKPAMMQLTLSRRTAEELEKFFGPNGIPPYPWYHDEEKKD